MSSYLKLPEVAHRLGVSEKTARRYIKSGALPSVFIGNSYRVDPDVLADFVERSGGGSQHIGEATADPKAVPPPEPAHSERHDLPKLEEIAKEAGHPLGWIMVSEEAFRDAFKGRTWAEVLEKAKRVVENIQVEQRDFLAVVVPIEQSTPYSEESERRFKELFNRINGRPIRAHLNAKEAADRAEAEGAPSAIVEGLKNVVLPR